MPKLYFYDFGIINMARESFAEMRFRPDIGNLIENFVFSELIKGKPDYDKLYFFSTTSKTEIDFIYHFIDKEILPIEVKFKDMARPIIPKALEEFCSQLKLKKAIILNKNLKSIYKKENTYYYFIPLLFTSKIKEFINV